MNVALFLLTLCQGLFLSNKVLFVAINGLVGLGLAPEPWMARRCRWPAVSRAARWQRTFQAGLLVASTVLSGYHNANASLYRFAAPELVGHAGGVVGPNLASATRDALPQPFRSPARPLSRPA